MDDVDLVDPRTHAENDLSAFWRRLRRERPVHRHPATGDRPPFWVLSKYADALATIRDDESFTSEQGNVLDTLLGGKDSAAGSMLPVTDGTRHAEIRRLLMKEFTPRALRQVVGQVRRTTRRLVLEALERGTCDVAGDIAAHIPLATMCDLLNVPAPDREFILGLTMSVLGSDEGTAATEDTWLARNEILLYFAELATKRRESPHADVVSMLVTTRIGGKPLTEAEVVLNCYSVILGGDETTRLSMTGAVFALTEYPDQWSALRGGEAGTDTATEEVLRWTCVPAHFGRTAIRDVVVGGQRIAAGDIVTGWLCSANRDEDVFGEPDRFDLARTPNKHLSFGHGPHFCLGAYLGRAQIGALLDELRTHVGRIEPRGPVRHIYSNFFQGISSLPVALKAARHAGRPA